MKRGPKKSLKRLEIGFIHEFNKVVEVLPDNYYVVECIGCGLKRRMWHFNILRQYGCRKCSQREFRAPITDPQTKRPTKEYVAWAAMIARCTQTMPHAKERYQDTIYKNMEIEPSWLGPDGYVNFYRDVGPAPNNTWLDREDNSKGYTRGNVRWATIVESNSNKSNIRMLTVFGETKTLSEWADDLGISAPGLAQRLDILKWSPEEAVTLPPERNRPVNEEYFLSIAGRVALRGNCARRQVGCVLVDEHNFVIATAYNSVPTGIDHCLTNPCEGANEPSGTRPSRCIAKHAEEIALKKCSDIYKIKDCYVTASPCLLCVRSLLDTSCKRIIFAEEYPDQEGKKIWLKSGREWIYYIVDFIK